MAIERTGHGDPARTVALLWGDPPSSARPTRGPRPRLDVPTITAAAVALADEHGLPALTMRALTTRLGLKSPNALYTYVPSKAELIDLIVDHCLGELDLDPVDDDRPIEHRVAAIAAANLAIHLRHPWLADVAQDRPPLGPGQLRKYDRELDVLTAGGIDDRDADLVLGLILGFVRAHASVAVAAARTEDEAAWWAQAGPALAARVDADDFPHARRVGSAAGAEQGRAFDPDVAFRFGVERIAAGVAALVGPTSAVAPAQPGGRRPHARPSRS